MMSLSMNIKGYDFEFTIGSKNHSGITLRPDNSELSNTDYLNALTHAFKLIPILEHEHSIFGWTYDDMISMINSANMASINRIEESCNALLEQDLFTYPPEQIAHIRKILGIINGSEKRKRKPKPARKPKPGYVYLLEAEKGYKIGVSKNPVDRISSLGVLLPFPITPIALIETPDMIGLERQLHERFADKRVNGEWFELSTEDVEYIKGLSK